MLKKLNFFLVLFCSLSLSSSENKTDAIINIKSDIQMNRNKNSSKRILCEKMNECWKQNCADNKCCCCTKDECSQVCYECCCCPGGCNGPRSEAWNKCYDCFLGYYVCCLFSGVGLYTLIKKIS